MFKNWGAWIGKDNGQVGEESDCSVDARKDKTNDQKTDEKHKNLTGYISTFASIVSQKLSESVIGTAESLKKSMEEGKLSEVIDKTILGDFQREQERFLQEKKTHKDGAAVPPWVGYSEEDAMQEQIFALSADKRNFLRDPPAGVQFHFDFDRMYPVAMVMLEEDELLRKMRFHLVPKQVKEEIFWRNYFYRVSLIKQSAQLTALAVQQSSKTEDDRQKVDAVKGASLLADSNEINNDDVHKGADELLLPQNKCPHLPQEETPDWERELQEELEEYDVVLDNENRDENWDREIEEMLKDDS